MLREILRYQPRFFGKETAEPSLRVILALYYQKNGSLKSEAALEKAEHYIKLLEAKFDEHS